MTTYGNLTRSSRMEIGDDTWIGQMAFLHSGGGIFIGKNVGIDSR